MRPIHQMYALIALLAGLAQAPARAETFNTCGTVIASLPAAIATPGVYCLSHDLNTAINSGVAIGISTNNVTIDCNGYKIGGLAAGVGSGASGIAAIGTRQNITVRNCAIRGFFYGIFLTSGAGHLIEDNRLDNNLYIGIEVLGDNNRVQRNRVYDTGGATGYAAAYGIFASADVIDNTVAGVFASTANTDTGGIIMAGDGTEARNNQVRGLIVAGPGVGRGIDVSGAGVTVRSNAIAQTAATNGYGISGNGVADTFCTGNNVAKFSTAIQSCQQDSSNLSH